MIQPAAVDLTPDAPEAPIHFDNEAASAWQSGWTSGFGAGVYSQRGLCTPQVSFEVYFEQSGFAHWPHPDRQIAKRAARSAWNFLTAPQGEAVAPMSARLPEIRMESPHISNGYKWVWQVRDFLDKTYIYDSGEHQDGHTASQEAANSLAYAKGEPCKPLWRDEVHTVKMWQQRAPHCVNGPISDERANAMQQEIDELRVYISGLHAGADFVNKTLAEERARIAKLTASPVTDLLEKPAGYRYSISGMYEYASSREKAESARKLYEDSVRDDPDFEHEEAEPLYTLEHVIAILAADRFSREGRQM